MGACFRIIRLCLVCCLLTLCVTTYCHEVRPAYLHINQTDSTSYHIIWKVPVTGGRINPIRPILPPGFEMSLTREKKNLSSLSQIYSGEYSASLIGQKIKIEHLEKTLIDVFTRVELADGLTYTFLIQADKPFCTIPTKPNKFEVIKSYTQLGIEHILEGYDHLLFVLALLLIISSFSNLFWTVTCFTLAHSITLAIASLNIFTLPSAPVETVIALSIIFLAKEYIDLQKGKPAITAKYPWVISFSFGLLHGFGFAGALQDIGFPQQQLFAALLSFNIGVELGQIFFILICLCLYFLFKKLIRISPGKKSRLILPYAIGSIASFWFLQRFLAILY